MLEFPAFLPPTNLRLPMHSPSALTKHVSLNLARFFFARPCTCICVSVMCTCAYSLSFHKWSCLRYFGVIASWNTFSLQLHFIDVLDARESYFLFIFFACFRKPTFSKLLYVLRWLAWNAALCWGIEPVRLSTVTRNLCWYCTHLFRWLVYFKKCLVVTI